MVLNMLARRVLRLPKPAVQTVVTKAKTSISAANQQRLASSVPPAWDYSRDEPNNKHRSNAEELVNQFPIVEVDANVALCDGGGGALGHPLEYIRLDTTTPEVPGICKYCGLRYRQKPHHH